MIEVFEFEFESHIWNAWLFSLHHSPQHCPPSHLSMSRAEPGHMRPQLLGGGLLHVRDRSLVPGPHEAEHCDQEDQRLHLPFCGTARVENDGKRLKQNEAQSACAKSTGKVTR